MLEKIGTHNFIVHNLGAQILRDHSLYRFFSDKTLDPWNIIQEKKEEVRHKPIT